MARYITDASLAAMAAEYSTTTQQVMTFISAQRSNGNINTVYDYIQNNPGSSDAEIVTATGIVADTVAKILYLLVFSNRIESF